MQIDCNLILFLPTTINIECNLGSMYLLVISYLVQIYLTTLLDILFILFSFNGYFITYSTHGIKQGL